MPLDPSIPLAGLRSQGEAPAPMNPFAMIGQWAQIQNAINQNRLFQQTFTAKQKAGQILAAAPDIESGLAALSQDPETAAWAGEIGNSFRQNMLALTQQQGEWQKQAETGLQAFIKMAPQLYADPSEENFNALADASLATVNPQIKDRVALGIGSLKKSLIDGLPEDPAQRQAAFQRRLGGLSVAGGLTPEGIKVIMGGEPDKIEGGGYDQPTFRTFGGQQIPTGPAYGKTLPPTVSEVPGQGPVILGGTPGLAGPTPLGGAMPGTRNPLMPGGGQAAKPSQGNGLVPQPVQSAPLAPPSTKAAPAVSTSSGRMAGNGKPLYDPAAMTDFLIAPTGKTAVGTPIRDPVILKKVEDANAAFDDKDTTNKYNQAVDALGSLNIMAADLDEMAKGAKAHGYNLTVPGPWAGVRTQIASTLNTIASMTGYYDPTKPIGPDNHPIVDPKAVMSAESFQKASETMKLQVVNNMLGAQREAATTITNIGKSVPSIENTYMGNKLLIASIQAALQRSIDQREFIQERANRYPNGIIGAETAFNKAFPAESYSNKVLSDFGLGKDGKFTGPDSVGRAFNNGLLTKEQAAKILLDQFGIKPRGQ